MIPGDLALSIVALMTTCVLGVLTFRNGRRGLQISQQALELNRMQQLERRAGELETKLESATSKLQTANDTIDNLQRRLRVTTEMADQATAEWQAVVKLIWRQGMTLERVQQYVGRPPDEMHGVGDDLTNRDGDTGG